MLLGYRQNRAIKLVYIVGILGTIIEWYDFCIYAYLASVFSQLFFATKSHRESILLVYTIFFVSYLARPLGGLFYGYIGDHFGRKQALILSISMMTISMFLTMSLPTWQTAGEVAPVLLLTFRIIQSLSTGGETTGAFIYVLESVNPKRHGLYGSIVWSMTFAGALLASGTIAVLTHFYSHEQLFHWGWRMAYLFGGIFGLVILILRSFIPESSEFLQARQSKTSEEQQPSPLIEGLRYYKRPLFIITALTAFPATAVYFIFIYFPRYAHQYFYHPLGKASALNTLMLLAMTGAIIVCGTLSDYIGRRKMVAFSAGCFLLFIYPILSILSHANWQNVVIAQTLLMTLIAIYEGALPAIIVNLLPLQIRYTILSLGFNIAFSIFGGSALLITEKLAAASSNHLAPAFYFMLLALLPLIALLVMSLKQGKEITDEN